MTESERLAVSSKRLAVSSERLAEGTETVNRRTATRGLKVLSVTSLADSATWRGMSGVVGGVRGLGLGVLPGASGRGGVGTSSPGLVGRGSSGCGR